MLVLLWLGLMTAWIFRAARENPTPKNLLARNLSVAFLAFAMLVGAGWAVGKDMAKRDAATHAACKP